MNSLFSLITVTLSLLRLIARMEARIASFMCHRLLNIKQSRVRITHFRVIAVMGISASLPMEIVKLILCFVEGCIKPKNAKTFGKRDFAFMGFAASFCIPNVRSPKARKTPEITRRRKKVVTWSLGQSQGCYRFWNEVKKMKNDIEFLLSNEIMN